MNTDIRISVSFRNHRKRKRLKMILGPGATDYLLDMWIATAMNRPSGVLHDMDAVDIALDAGWEGEPEEFVGALVKCGFMDFDGETYSMHDWEDHQGYVVHSEARTERAKKAARAKYGRDDGSDEYDYKNKRSQRLAEARKKGRHTDDEWSCMVSILGGKCLSCGATENIVKDHIIPLYQGGSDGVENIQPLCRSCNSSKGPESYDYRPSSLGSIDWKDCESIRRALVAHKQRTSSAQAVQENSLCTAPSPAPIPAPSPAPIPAPSPAPIPAPNAQETRVRDDADSSDPKPKFAPGPAPSEYSSEFLQLAEQYPRKDEGLSAAWIAFKQCKAAHAYPGNPIVLPILVQWRVSPQWTDDGGRFVPNFSRWIRERRWEAGPPEDEKAKVAKQVADMMAIRDMKKAGGMRQ